MWWTASSRHFTFHALQCHQAFLGSGAEALALRDREAVDDGRRARPEEDGIRLAIGLDVIVLHVDAADA